MHVLLQGGSGATWGRRRGTKANGPAKRGAPRAVRELGRGMGHQCWEATVSQKTQFQRVGGLFCQKQEEKNTGRGSCFRKRSVSASLGIFVCGHVRGRWSRRLKACYLSKDKHGGLSLGGGWRREVKKQKAPGDPEIHCELSHAGRIEGIWET